MIIKLVKYSVYLFVALVILSSTSQSMFNTVVDKITTTVGIQDNTAIKQKINNISNKIISLTK